MTDLNKLVGTSDYVSVGQAVMLQPPEHTSVLVGKGGHTPVALIHFDTFDIQITYFSRKTVMFQLA